MGGGFGKLPPTQVIRSVAMNTMERFYSDGIYIALILCMVAACTKEAKRIPDHVNLQLKWEHQAQFAGFYLAYEKGYYKDEHINVSFLEGGEDIDVLTSLVSGAAHFAVASSEMVLMQRKKESAPITAIAVIYRKSAVVYVTKADAGICDPTDFIGKTAAVIAKPQSHSEFEYQFNALVRKRGIDITQIHMVSYNPDYKDFISGKIDITAAYYTGGVMKLRNKGVAVNLIWPNDYGIHFYSDTLISTEHIIHEKPDLVERFLKATLKGWREVIAYPEEAVDITMKYAKVKDRSLQADMLSAMAPLVHTGKDHIGWMNGDVWYQMHQVLVDENILSAEHIDFRKVYTMKFLEKIYLEESKK
jgi:NitT/TauT family transport system substrate-binding protein